MPSQHLNTDSPSSQLTEQFTVDQVKEMLGEIIDNSYQKAQELQKAEGYIKLERGFATIPLPGIDVPFHSRYLWAGVMPFRACKFSSCIYPHDSKACPQTSRRRSTPRT